MNAIKAFIIERYGVLSRRLSDDFRSMYEIGLTGRALYRGQRKTADYRAVFEKSEPLVSVCIATYNRSALLLDRSLKSILAQDYRNLDIVVVGDGCSDDTEQQMRTIPDSRVRFFNLPSRGCYPDEPYLSWMVAGTAAFNHALYQSRGDFITHLDDDDEHTPDRISKLVSLVKRTRADFVWHPYQYETPAGDWRVNEARHFRFAQVSTSSVFYHRWFRHIPWDADAYKLLDPGDWNRFRKFRFIGARTLRHPDVMLKHYRERNQQSR